MIAYFLIGATQIAGNVFKEHWEVQKPFFRGLENGFKMIADFLIGVTQIASNVFKEHWKVQKQFLRGLENKDIIELANWFEDSLSEFAMPVFDDPTYLLLRHGIRRFAVVFVCQTFYIVGQRE